MGTSADIILAIPILFFAVVLHEFSHGWVAYLCGDDTAKQMGRLTLNPLPHVDLFGTILLPMLLLIIRSPVLIGWAKPVPINPYRLRNPVNDMAKVGLAGPGANFAFAVLSALVIWLIKISGVDPFSNTYALIIKLLYINVQVNLVLGVFNLIPIPPLDGSRIVSALLPFHLAQKYNQLERYGIIIVFLLLSLGLLDFLWYVVVFIQKLLFIGI
jgi:Zn-dependent protease